MSDTTLRIDPDSMAQLDDLKARLLRWAQFMPNRTRKAMLAGAEVVIGRSRSEYLKAPEADKTRLHVRTGRLWRSLHAKADVSGTEVKLYIGTNVIYARIHELGGDIPRGTGRPTKMPARPYLRPALRDVQPQLPRIILSHLKAMYEGGAE